MSYTEIYRFGKDGTAELFKKIKNSWRGCAAFWMQMEEKYLPPHESGHTRLFQPTNAKMGEIWDLADNPTLPEHERVIFLTTFDKCLVRKENIGKVVEAFRKYDGETSLPEQADALDELTRDPDCIAVGWNQSSISGDAWTSEGEPDEEGNGTPYNCRTGTKHFWLFEKLGEATTQG